MQVLTLDDKAFEEHVANLAAKVIADLPKEGYDAVVGIRRGGSIVCDLFCQNFPHDFYGFRTDITLQRPSTKNKGAALCAFLKNLPRPLLDVMRIAEAKMLGLKKRVSTTSPLKRIDIPGPLLDVLKNQHARILLIDDAIDSGDTLFSVIDALKDVNESVQIKVAVITVTTKAPRVVADYDIYHNNILVRFPWSNDYKK